MGKFTFNLPDIGEGIAEAEIVAWHIKPGDTIEEDQQIADMMTDKATVEMESPVSGKVIEVAGEVGDTIAIGSMLVVIETEGGDGAEAAPAPAEETPSGKAETVEERIEVENPDAGDADRAMAAEVASGRSASGSASQPKRSGRAEGGEKAASERVVEPRPAQPEPVEDRAPTHAKVLASPAVRARAKDLGIDLAEVKPAADGRLRHADLDSFLSYSGGYSPAARSRGDEAIKVIGMRRRIAENMAASKRNIPHFTFVEEIDVTDLEELRTQLNANRGAKPKLTLLPLIITAICKTLPDFPMINARFDDEAGVVTRHGAVHLGMATQTDAGLMVPVIRDAQAKNLWQLATEIMRLAEAARSGKAKSEELSGSTITVTSLGPLGGVATTPVINRPEVAIIGPNRIVERPMFVSDGMGGERIARRKLMNMSISCDHRVVDGWDAASFVQAIRKLLETPALLLIG